MLGACVWGGGRGGMRNEGGTRRDGGGGMMGGSGGMGDKGAGDRAATRICRPMGTRKGGEGGGRGLHERGAKRVRGWM